MFQIKLPFGRTEIALALSREPLVLQERQSPQVYSEDLELERAIRNPIGSRKLRELTSSGDKIAIIINDVTRPIPSDKIVPVLLRELECGSIRRDDVTVVVATGVHRGPSRDELRAMLGSDLADKIRVENHDSMKADELVDLGKTRRGVPVVINKTVAKADVKIATGMVTPHHVAGYSGGRKSIMPGVAGLDALRVHHSEKIRPYGPAMGILEGNMFHEEAEEAASILGIDFIVNVVLNSRRQLVKAVAGDWKEAWNTAVTSSESMYRVDVAQQADIVIASPGGYPKDIDLWQAQKAISPAEMVVREGGTIVLVAECQDGFGGHNFSNFFEGTTSPRDVIDEFNRRGYEPGLSKAFMYARALEKAEIIVVTKRISDAELAKAYTKRADSIDEALKMAKDRLGDDAQVAVLPHATEVVPRVSVH
jgi:nickel-dependent lactate racemase